MIVAIDNEQMVEMLRQYASNINNALDDHDYDTAMAHYYSARMYLKREKRSNLELACVSEMVRARHRLAHEGEKRFANGHERENLAVIHAGNVKGEFSRDDGKP